MVTQVADARFQVIRPWDPLVRVAHWGVAGVVLLNGLIVEEGSDFHRWLGYGAAALLALRLLWGFVGPAEARFSAFPPRPRAALHHLAGLLAGRDQPHRSHNPLGALMVYTLWLTLGVVAATGIAMADPPWVARPVHVPTALERGRESPTAAPAIATDEREGDDGEHAHREEHGPGEMHALSGQGGEGYRAPSEARDEMLEEVHEAAANLLMVLAALHVAGVAVQSRISGGRELRRITGIAPRDA